MDMTHLPSRIFATVCVILIDAWKMKGSFYYGFSLLFSTLRISALSFFFQLSCISWRVSFFSDKRIHVHSYVFPMNDFYDHNRAENSHLSLVFAVTWTTVAITLFSSFFLFSSSLFLFPLRPLLH